MDRDSQDPERATTVTLHFGHGNPKLHAHVHVQGLVDAWRFIKNTFNLSSASSATASAFWTSDQVQLAPVAAPPALSAVSLPPFLWWTVLSPHLHSVLQATLSSLQPQMPALCCPPWCWAWGVPCHWRWAWGAQVAARSPSGPHPARHGAK